MILNAEDRQFLVPHAFHCVVVQIDMADLDVLRERFGIDCEPVVLRGDRDPAALQIFHRLIRAAMTELEFECRSPERETEDLMAETDSEDWPLAHEIANGFVGVRKR